MSDQPVTTGHDDDDALASEFVLGVLEGEERRRCAARVESDPAFARLVTAWEARLGGLDVHYDEAAPPARAKAAIDARLFGAPPAAPRWTLWSSLAFLRGLSIAAVAAVAVLAAVLVNEIATEPVPGTRLVASLAPVDSDAVFVALLEDTGLSVTHIAGARPADRDFELWLIAGEDAPRSLGLVREGAAPERAADFAAQLIEGVTLAVSLEPTGGSPGPGPTGPVVAAGQLKKI